MATDTGTTVVRSACGCSKVVRKKNIAMPVFWMPVSIAIVNESEAL